MKIVLELTTQEWIDLSGTLEDVKVLLQHKPIHLDRYSDEDGEKLAKINVVNKVLIAMRKPATKK